MKKVFFIIMLMFSLQGCSYNKPYSDEQILIPKEPKVLGDLAYDANAAFEHIIYLLEDSEYKPYIVLTNDYNGACLLLRENLLDEPGIYNQDAAYGAFYENSAIDSYLNDTFYNLIADSIQNNLLSHDIEIAAKESFGIGGKSTITISRKIFLLSFTEVGGTSYRVFLKEGESLDYFKDKEDRIAYYENGSAGSWWLRTASTADKNLVCGVSKEGYMGSGGIEDIAGLSYNGVRPAFCMPRDLSIKTILLDGQAVFTIEDN